MKMRNLTPNPELAIRVAHDTDMQGNKIKIEEKSTRQIRNLGDWRANCHDAVLLRFFA